MLQPGDPAPAFSVTDHNGQVHTLAGYAGRPVVLWFYPAALTGG